MAVSWLINGGYALTTYDTWDDPASRFMGDFSPKIGMFFAWFAKKLQTLGKHGLYPPVN